MAVEYLSMCLCVYVFTKNKLGIKIGPNGVVRQNSRRRLHSVWDGMGGEEYLLREKEHMEDIRVLLCAIPVTADPTASTASTQLSSQPLSVASDAISSSITSFAPSSFLTSAYPSQSRYSSTYTNGVSPNNSKSYFSVIFYMIIPHITEDASPAAPTLTSTTSAPSDPQGNS
ncbi:hypothetical protein BB560_006677 [Smittium megazygosporum]|uniref:Uncharacterized protein n=1 Tax=Smittium megazygosporum TaxID=133381 RepID=A0A2T9Y2K3_9FUNG|nr:hypothetical protein BB560_006677 [Smittium megazygosporum]